MVKIRELMNKHIVGVSIETTVDSARKLMGSMHVELIPVLSEGKLSGIILDMDLRELQGEDKVGHAMRKAVFVEADEDSKEAAKKLIENAFGRIPVVDNKSDMHCVGIISTTDVVKSSK